MAFAALYDIHGNTTALEAVLTKLQNISIKNLIVGGDVIPGPDPMGCLEILEGLPYPKIYIIGNGEEAVIQAKQGNLNRNMPENVQNVIQWTADQLSESWIQKIETWKKTYSVLLPSGSILFCHATPDSPTDIFTKMTQADKLPSSIAQAAEETIVCGHTHMQYDINRLNKRILNPGSVGMPFGEPGAYWLLIDEEIHLMKTQYNFVKAASHVINSEYPDAETFAQENILNPPGEEKMLKLFASND